MGVWITLYALIGLAATVLFARTLAPFDSHVDRVVGGAIALVLAGAIWPLLGIAWLIARVAEALISRRARRPHHHEWDGSTGW